MTDESKRKRRRKIAAGAVAALAVVGAGGAIAATQVGSPSEESQKIIDDAAEELGVQPSELSAALKKALKNRVDEALADGRLTEEQADAIKERIDSNEYPLIFGGRGFGYGHFGGHHAFANLDTAASYLGLTEAELRTELQEGNSLADVAKEKGKSVDGLVDALVAEAKKDVDAAVSDGRLTKAQGDSIKADLEERITALVNGEGPKGGPWFGRGEGPGWFGRGDAPGFGRGDAPGWFGPGPAIGGGPASFGGPTI